MIQWSDHSWTVFSSEERGPGPNAWSEECVEVDQAGNLNLSIKYLNNKWRCGEIMTTQSLGLGRYRWIVESDLSDLEPWAVLGLFTYDWQAPAPYNEIDIEASKWGWPTEQNDGMVSAQPNWVKTFPWSTHPPYICQFEWKPRSIVYTVRDKDKEIFSATAKKTYKHKDEKAYCNLWLNEGHDPKGPVTIKLSKFSFVPR